jgi:type IV secretion system protein VirB8
MTGVPSSDLKTYFSQARSWDHDRLVQAKRSTRLAWAIAAVASLLAGAAIAAIAALVPLKTVEPFVVRVDRATGSVDVMSGLKGQADLTYEEAVSKYFLSVYVRARESWLPAAAQANFRQVSIMSTAEEQRRWAELFRPVNPVSPQLAYGPNGQAEVAIRAISFVTPSVANVRYQKIVRQGSQVTQSDWISTIGFRYTAAPMLEADRLLNPLGFQVSSYRADPEVVR